MRTLKQDIPKYSKLIINEFAKRGKTLDYSLESMQIIEDFLNEELPNATSKKESFFEEGMGTKLFALSSYLGEVIIKNTKATKWIIDDNDPKGEINIKLLSANKCEMFPAHRVLNRIKNGDTENLFHYASKAINELMKFEGEIPKEFDTKKKAWWKFW